jgi:DNA-binding MarR family transcriptional regulator
VTGDGPPTSESGSESSLPVLDPVIHAQPRLRVTVALAALGRDDRIAFPRLQKLVDMTAGNLATHLHKLEDAGYVVVTKAYQRRTPVTWISLSAKGRRAFDEYTETLDLLLAAVHTPPDSTNDKEAAP